MKIVLLADRPELIADLARLYEREWAPYYGASGPADAARDLADCLKRDRIPLALVALDEAGGAMGTAALKARSAGPSAKDLGPWLAALVVRREARG